MKFSSNYFHRITFTIKNVYVMLKKKHNFTFYFIKIRVISANKKVSLLIHIKLVYLH